MRKNLLLISTLTLTLLNTAYSQTDRFAYVITDNVKDGINWNVLRKIDLLSNSYSDVLLNGSDASQLAFDANTKKQFTAPVSDARFGTVANAAFGTGVAAIAYDNVLMCPTHGGPGRGSIRWLRNGTQPRSEEEDRS